MRREGEPPESGRPGREGVPGYSTAEDRARRARLVKVLVGVGLLVILIIFVSTNLDSTPVEFVFFSAEVPLIWVMLACSVIGGLVGFLLGKPGKQIGRREGDRSDD